MSLPNSLPQEVCLIFPHQLFPVAEWMDSARSAILIEDELFFTHYPFHKKKLVLHRASMKVHESRLTSQGIKVFYVEYSEPESHTEHLFGKLAGLGVRKVHLYDPVDYLLRRRLERYAKRYGILIAYYLSPMFLNSLDELKLYFKSRRRYFLNDFYIDQRKKKGILLDGNGDPLGGKWTYDAENRKSIPKGLCIPSPPSVNELPEVKEAMEYVNIHFPENPGSIEGFRYPVTEDQARESFGLFLQERFSHYGVYQDAIRQSETWLFHAVLTPALNIGLISPHFVITETIKYAEAHDIALNSLEGFIRQVVGWREYIRAVYELDGVKERTSNFFEHTRKIPPSFWNGTTGILPIDEVIHRLNKECYSHHIERLMVLGNFMLLCEFDPDEVHAWFMSLFIDSYDWVMVPNVYGMSQFADGGLMSTKPYISGSAYVLKMSNYSKGPWTEIWDGLFWRFIEGHSAYFLRNPRLSMMVHTLRKMNPDRRKSLMGTAENWLAKLDGEAF